MPSVNVELPGEESRAYEVVIEPGGVDRLGEQVAEVVSHARAMVIVDAGVDTTWGRRAAKAMDAAGFDTAVAVMPVSEKSKTLGTVRNLYALLLQHRMERGSPVVTVGGGITGDTGGFVAATYLRGVPFVQCPTTLLAMVDASVGGKVGVNVPEGKNLIGAFWQPRRVVIDPLTLETLNVRQVRCGLAECVKHGVIRDPALFAWIEEHVDALLEKDTDALVELVERNVRIKAAVVGEDEREAGVRAHLNFGHTFGHAIEATNRFSGLMHGEAVAVGMMAATKLAIAQGMCDPALEQRLGVLLERIGLPATGHELASVELLMRAMQLDKKVKDDQLRLVLPTRLGEVVVRDDVPVGDVEAAWRAIGAN